MSFKVINEKIYLVAGKRTPFGKFGGSLMNISPVDLSVHSSKALLDSLSLSADKIDQVILGNVVPSTTDVIYGARHLALKLGCQEKTPGVMVNRLCGSGLEAILQATQLIKLGIAQSALAAGTENMSLVPHALYGSRFGTKYGSLQSVDFLLDALTDKYTGCPMGITAENLAEIYKISRSECDEFALKSHQKAASAQMAKHFAGEIAPYPLKKMTLEIDEHLRLDASIEGMNKLTPSFKKDGVVTAASASGIVDGASSTLIASESFCKTHKLTPIAEIIDGNVVGVDPKIMGIGPVPAIKNILENSKMKIEEIDYFEINEAFAAQTLACQKELSIDSNKLNIWGGAIALGHPLGASGNRISLTLARQLQFNKKQFGIAAACIGGGQGIAVLLKRV